MSDIRNHPHYAQGYEHGFNAHTPFMIDSDEYLAGHKAGRDARKAFLGAGMTQTGPGQFGMSVTIKGKPRHD